VRPGVGFTSAWDTFFDFSTSCAFQVIIGMLGMQAEFWIQLKLNQILSLNVNKLFFLSKMQQLNEKCNIFYLTL